MFRRWSLITCCASGFALATYMTDQGALSNREYQRPDFKPKAAMVKDHSAVYDQQQAAQLKQLYKVRDDPEEIKKSSLYRFFFPLDASYETNRNPWHGADPLNSVNPADGSFPNAMNNYADHKN